MTGWTSVQSSGSETGLRRIMSFMHLKHLLKKTMKIRSKHNDLLNYFVHDTRDLSPAYVKKCRAFLKIQASKNKQAPQLEYTSKQRKE